MKKILFHTGGVSMVFLLLSVSAFYISVKRYHKAAIEFWGDAYTPEEHDESKMKMDFPLSFVVPQGGPIASNQYFGVCLDDPLPLVPVKYNSKLDRFEAFCGFGTSSEIQSFTVDDPEIVRALKPESI